MTQIKPGDLVKLKPGSGAKKLYLFSDDIRELAENVAMGEGLDKAKKATKVTYTETDQPMLFLGVATYQRKFGFPVYKFVHQDKVWAALLTHDSKVEDFYYKVS